MTPSSMKIPDKHNRDLLLNLKCCEIRAYAFRNIYMQWEYFKKGNWSRINMKRRGMLKIIYEPLLQRQK